MFKRKNIFFVLAALALLLTLTTVALAGDDGTNYVDFEASESDYINVGTDAAFDFTGDFTVEAWIYRESGSAEMVIAAEGYDGSVTPYELKIDASNFAWFRTYDSGSLGAQSSSTIPTGEWVHIAGVFEDAGATGTWHIFVNGVLEDSNSTTAPAYPTPGQRLLVGAVSTGAATQSQFFDGYMDEVRIWDVARTAEEINQSMFSELSPGLETDLVVYYDFNNLFGGSDEVWDESNGTQYDGTNNGTSQFGPSRAPIWDKQQYSHRNMAAIWDSNTTGTSHGLTVMDNNFIQNDGDDVIFGQTYADENTNTDLPTTGDWASAPNPARWEQVWYSDAFDTDSDPPAGSVDLVFDFDIAKPDPGGPGAPNWDVAGPASNYRLLERAGTSGQFTDIATAAITGSNKVTFTGVTVSSLCSYITLGTLDNQNSPTAVSLQSLTASAARNTWIPVALALIALVGVGTLTFVRKRR